MSWEPPFSTGSEIAEPTGLRRLLRQPGRGNLLMAGGAILAAGVLILPGGNDESPLSHPAVPPASVPSPSATLPVDAIDSEPSPLMGTPVAPMDVSAAATPAPTAEPAGDRVMYSIYAYKLPGLAPDAPPGTSLDIWVTWSRSVADAPRVDLLVRGAILHRLETGFEDGPVADLIMRRKDLVNMIYGEKFGTFHVSVAAP